MLKDKNQLPALHGDLLYSSPGVLSSAPYLNCAGGKGNASGCHFSTLKLELEQMEANKQREIAKAKLKVYQEADEFQDDMDSVETKRQTNNWS